jgi:hypothetical protein
LTLEVRASWAFLDVVLGLDPAAGLAEADRLALEHGVILQRR